MVFLIFVMTIVHIITTITILIYYTIIYIILSAPKADSCHLCLKEDY